MSALDIGELAEGILPFAARHKVIALLFGYFDESGTDGLHGHTVISGFVGTVASWRSLVAPWRAELERVGVPYFHYVDAKGHNKKYKHFAAGEWLPHVTTMAKIICGLDLKAVSAAFSGDWNSCVAGDEEWQARFPSAYHFCFELMIEKIRKASDEHWGGEPVAIIMSRQNEFAERALKVWDFFKYNAAWQQIAHVGYNDPHQLTQLQAADALAYETRRGLWKDSDDHWLNELPLTSRLIAKHDALGGVIFDNGYKAAGLKELMARPKGPYLTIPPQHRKD